MAKIIINSAAARSMAYHLWHIKASDGIGGISSGGIAAGIEQ